MFAQVARTMSKSDAVVSCNQQQYQRGCQGSVVGYREAAAALVSGPVPKNDQPKGKDRDKDS